MSRLLLCALVSWAALASNTSARADEFEDLAVAEVRKVGGAVVRDETRPDKPVVGLKMRFNGLVNDLTLKHIVAFKSLTFLELWNSEITDEGVKELVRLKNLTSLELTHTRLTHDGLTVQRGFR